MNATKAKQLEDEIREIHNKYNLLKEKYYTGLETLNELLLEKVRAWPKLNDVATILEYYKELTPDEQEYYYNRIKADAIEQKLK